MVPICAVKLELEEEVGAPEDMGRLDVEDVEMPRRLRASGAVAVVEFMSPKEGIPVEYDIRANWLAGWNVWAYIALSIAEALSSSIVPLL